MIERATKLDLESCFDVSKLDVWDVFDLLVRVVDANHWFCIRYDW